MAKIVSKNIVIGNFLIEAVNRDILKVNIQKLFDFEEELSERLIKYDYYTKFDSSDLTEFQEEYPWAFNVKDKYICIDDSKGNNYLINMLIRYFRLGVPYTVTKEVRAVARSVFF